MYSWSTRIIRYPYSGVRFRLRFSSIELKLERSPALLGVTDALGLRGDGASSLVVFNKAKDPSIHTHKIHTRLSSVHVVTHLTKRQVNLPMGLSI